MGFWDELDAVGLGNALGHSAAGHRDFEAGVGWWEVPHECCFLISLVSACSYRTAGRMRGAAQVSPLSFRAMPPAAAAASTGRTASLKRKTATIAAIVRTRAAMLTLLHTGTSSDSRATRTSRTSPNKACSANQAARLAMTPTTAAVIADSAPVSALFPRSRSMNGAPRKIHR